MYDNSKNILKAKNLCKSFHNNHVLKDICFDLKFGEVHGIIGPNGAGKSSLIKLFSGVYKSDCGEILLKNKVLAFNNPHKSLKAGISVVYQELDLIPDLTVAENITLGLEKKFLNIFYSKNNECCIAEKALHKLNVTHIPLNKNIRNLSIADQQSVAIAKALSHKSKIIILDEPTAALTYKEIENLFKVINKLKNNGISFIYISHRLEEIIKICDRISVLKDGNITYSCKTSEITHDIIIEKIASKKSALIESNYNKQLTSNQNHPVLELKNLSFDGRSQSISLTLNTGEIIGLAGFAGSGRTELLNAIFGVARSCYGDIFIDGQKNKIKSPKHAIKNGIGMVPEDRKLLSIFPDTEVYENITFNGLRNFLSAKFVIKTLKRIREAALRVKKMNIVSSSLKQPISELSGGNQQKAILANWFFENLKVILLDEPTRGVDISSKNDIYSIIEEWKTKGISFIVVSSDFNELIRLCSRIFVLRDNRIIKSFENNNITEDTIIKTILGNDINEIKS
jgi:ribose transport system ATP-binding protein